MAINNKTYNINLVDGIDSPALAVFPEIIQQNIQNAITIGQNENHNILRPHVKTVKCKEPILMAMRHGVYKYKCSTISEAEMLGDAGAKDVLICSQLSKTKAQRFNELLRKFPDTHFSSIIDNIPSAIVLSEVFSDSSVSIFIDINIGMDRTGIPPNQVLRLIKSVRKLPNIKIQGFHCYEGHISASDPIVRKALSEATFTQLNEIRIQAEQFIGKTLKLVIGGSPTFSFYANKPNVECSPGTIFLWDSGYSKLYKELPFTPAAVVLTRIIAIVSKHKLCLDLGYKAVASDSPLPRITFPDIPNYKVVGQYEEHMTVEVPSTAKYKVGDPWLGIPVHICPTVNLYEELIPIINGNQQKTWKVIARDRKITI
ncbi:alanine racemase [Arenibacter sp. F26102]|uniref:alanine racemase n=1 Tax=Arenibacter sp. F26102 TaxID=2926416 RepID=UPI001FF3C5AC|nr:alanine racemase [Arenibacter sp. F26102]MCK0148034.1 alanine racemase [Arenibacter sp. F26102]